MSVTPKMLCQESLSAGATAVYTTPADHRTQITEIWITNTSTTDSRDVALFAHGTAAGNTIAQKITVEAEATTIIDGSKIVLDAAEVLAASQDAGTDVILTAYGVEEDLS